MTAADQPTTEPSETRDAIASVVGAHQYAGLVGRSHDDPSGIRWSCACGHGDSVDGMSGHSSWLAAHALHAADELLAALAPQPAADTETWTETEVQWGVRERPLVHGVTLLSSEDDARGLARRDHGVVVTRAVTTTTTPWEEA